MVFSGSLVALITPMNGDDSIDFISLRSLIDFHLDKGTDGLVLVGTTSESATLLFSERLAIVDFVIRYLTERCPDKNQRPKIIVGNGSNCTRHTIERTIEFDALDFDGYLTVVPYYNKPNQKGLIAHFRAVADQTDKPLLLYNVPSRTVVDLLPSSVAELAKHDNIVGIKEASGDIQRLRQIKQLCGTDFACLSGDDPSSLAFLKAGGDGVISVTANVAPQQMLDMLRACAAGDHQLAASINQGLEDIHRQLFIDSNPIPVKWVLQQMELIASCHVRLPLLPLQPIHYKAVRQAMVLANII